MKGKYEAAFLIPLGASRHLAEDGWEFESKNYICKSVEFFLTDVLRLEFLKTDLGITYYANDTIQASIFYGESSENIEHVFFQVYKGCMEFLTKAFSVSELIEKVELFLPHEEADV